MWELPGSKYSLEAREVAVLPIGSLERHGDHLPLGTDAIEAAWVAKQVADRLGAHLFPTIWYGVSPGLSRFDGTVSVSADAFTAYVYDVLKEIARNGYRIVVIINGHGGNSAAIRVAMKKAAYETGATYAMFDWWRDVGRDSLAKLFTSPGHAGEDETSAMLYIDGEHVDMSSAQAHSSPYMPSMYVESVDLDRLLYPEAVLGDPTKASAEKGRQWLEAVVEEIVNKVWELRSALAASRLNPS